MPIYYPGATWDGSSFSLSGYQWSDKPVYRSNDPIRYGQSIGLLRRMIVGAPSHESVRCGSRSADCFDFTSSQFGTASIRGCNGTAIILGRIYLPKDIRLDLHYMDILASGIIRIIVLWTHKNMAMVVALLENA